MQSIMSIKNNSIYQIENNVNVPEDNVIVKILNFVNASAFLEIYKGNEYYNTMLINISGTIGNVTLPAEIFTGNNIHFRIKSDTLTHSDLEGFTYNQLSQMTHSEMASAQYGPFIHVTYNPDKSFNFSQLNYVVAGN